MKDFNEEYNEIIAKCKDQILVEKSLAKSRKKKKTSIILCIGLMIELIFMAIDITKNIKMGPLMVGVAFAFSIILVAFITMRDRKFRLMYKNTLINQVILCVDKNLLYLPLDKFPVMNFNRSPFYQRYDEYFSEDLIRGTLENGTEILMGEIHTHRIETERDSDGITSTKRVPVFDGVMIEATLPIECFNLIQVVPNSKLRELSSKRVEMDSMLFEKYYDLITRNKIEAVKLFTPEILELFEKFVELKWKNFGLIIEGNKLYLKFRPNHEYLESTLSDKMLTKPYVQQYFDDVYYGINLINELVKQLKYLEK